MLALAGAAATASATTLHVDDDNCPGPGDGTARNPFCSIQDAINAASANDTVMVEPGTYLEQIDFDGKAITVRSTDWTDPAIVEATTIDGQGASHVVWFDSSEGPNSILQGFTIIGGIGAPQGGPPTDLSGGGILIDQASPIIRGCVIRDNSAQSFGGGVFITNSSVAAIVCCTFLNMSRGMSPLPTR